MRKIVYLLGCGSKKRPAGWSGAAEDLYTGSLFKAKQAFANRVGARWWIVSAKYGLLDRSTIVQPYDLTVGDLDRCSRSLWALKIAQDCLVALCWDGSSWSEDPQNFDIHLHMGREYADPTEVSLRTAGFVSVLRPVEGLGQGEQMRWYSEDRDIRGGYRSLNLLEV